MRINPESIDKMGIYSITGTYSDDFPIYIGSTAQSFKARSAEHESRLRRGVHDNQYLQRAYNKHGAENFAFNVVEVMANKDDVIEREQYYLDLLWASDRKKYNIAPLAIGGGYNAEPYPEYVNDDGRVMPAGENLSAACRERGLDQSHMRRVARGELSHHKGWRLAGAPWAPHGLAKPYPEFINDDGRVIPAGVNMNAMCRKYGLDRVGMRRVARGELSHHKGWRLADG